MKEIKLKHGEASILKLTMSFAIYNEYHIKDEPIIKTADLMAIYISVNTYHMPIFRTLIDINLKSIKIYLDSMSWNEHWQNDFEAHLYLNKTVDKFWMKHERRYLYECISEHINALQKDYIFIIKSKEEKLYEERKIKHKIKHYITQLCIKCWDNTVWLNKTSVSLLKLHWDIMVDIQLFVKYLKFFNKNYNYTIKQSVKNVKKTAAVWVTNSKIKKRSSIKISFVTAVHISQMNLLAPFEEIN